MMMRLPDVDMTAKSPDGCTPMALGLPTDPALTVNVVVTVLVTRSTVLTLNVPQSATSNFPFERYATSTGEEN